MDRGWARGLAFLLFLRYDTYRVALYAPYVRLPTLLGGAHILPVPFEYLGAVCFEAGEVCEAERSRAPSSDTFMLSGAVAAGMMTRPLRLGTRSEGVDIAGGLLAGREWVEAGFGRGDCLNCRVRGLDVRGGFFLEPTLEWLFFPDFGLGVSYRIYSPASDLQGRFTVRFMARG